MIKLRRKKVEQRGDWKKHYLYNTMEKYLNYKRDENGIGHTRRLLQEKKTET